MESSSVPLIDPQLAAVAKLGCAVAAPPAVAALCGPPGVGKTTVLERLAADLRGVGREARIGDVAGWLEAAEPLPELVIADDAHLAEGDALARLVNRCLARRPAVALVLAGEGRLLTLVHRDPRLAQAVGIRVALLPGRLADTRRLVEQPEGRAGLGAAVVAVIHELAAGFPAEVIRLATLADVVATSRRRGEVTVADVEELHARLSLRAA